MNLSFRELLILAALPAALEWSRGDTIAAADRAIQIADAVLIRLRAEPRPKPTPTSIPSSGTPRRDEP